MEKDCDKELVTFEYTNHRGVTETRKAHPIDIEWDEVKGAWVLHAYCVGRRAIRSFLLTGCKWTAPPPPASTGDAPPPWTAEEFALAAEGATKVGGKTTPELEHHRIQYGT